MQVGCGPIEVLSKAEFVICGLLAEGPCHAYGLDKTIEQREIRVWATLSFPSLYRLADKLEGRGLLKSKAEQVRGRPPRRVFHLSSKGREALILQVEAILREVPSDSSSISLALMFARACPPARFRSCLYQMLATIQERQQLLRAKRREVKSRYDDPIVDAIFGHDLALLTAQRRWAQALLAKIGGPRKAVNRVRVTRC